MEKFRSPQNRLGIFKQLSDVPTARRLCQFQGRYQNTSTWESYRATTELSDRMSEDWELFLRRWRKHMSEQGRHCILAQPTDVEVWSGKLLSRFSRDRTYQHWYVIEGLYEWLKWHVNHPHTYNPFHMAASVPGSSANEVWIQKQERNNA